MTSPAGIAPVYFFDQPTNRSKTTGIRRDILYLEMSNDTAQLEERTQSPENVDKDSISDHGLPQRLSPETFEDHKPETSFKFRDHNVMEAYKRASPHLLNELAHLLSRYKWAEEGRLPLGIVNILNYSWKDLTAGVVHIKSQVEIEKKGRFKVPPKLDEARSSQTSAKHREETEGTNSSDVSMIKPQVNLNPHMKKRKQNPNTAHSSTSLRFSFPSDSCRDPGWIIQPKQPSCDEPQRSLCQWVVERLQAARDPEKLRTVEQENPTVQLCYYGDAKTKVKTTRAKKKAQPVAQTPEVKQRDHAQKLHFKTSDGTSFIYYPSGCTAVCQSHSGLPCGGFYTNVFSDSECPLILATITAFGHGSVTHPVSSAVTAVWDQDGGFMCDQDGNITKEWSWLEYRTLREKIVIQVSDHISIRLLSRVSATLCFRCDGESVQLPLSALHYRNQPKEKPCLQTKEKFMSDFAQDLLLGTKTKTSAVNLESETNLTSTLVIREVEKMVKPPEQWRRDLKRLQQRVRIITEDWLGYYCDAIGIKYPGVERMPDAPLRTRLRRQVQSAVLPSLNPPERADAKQVEPEDDSRELQKLYGHLSAQADRPQDTCVKLSRSVIIPHSPDLQHCAVPQHPSPPSFIPSGALTACPAQLRAALQGEGGRKRCCCGTALMPALTDLEYDAFIMSQPPHSQQILVVSVTLPQQTDVGHDQMEQLYRRRNKHRITPCTQSQMDSYRLLRYEMSTRKPDCKQENILLQQRHNAAPGMVLMYIRAKLLFVGFIFSGHSCSVRDLENQISRTRGDYRLGLSLPPDFRFSGSLDTSAEKDEHSSQDSPLKGRHDVVLTAAVKNKRVNVRKYDQGLQGSHHKTKTIQSLPHVPVVMH
ncbi:uncharacterized protein LOC117814340 isoform X1 [Xyrichtys novacula]|uniref:Uncharacterized protein LOC117814340 isoform X1 n=1 Tax=Xyrichtys novacula TaxID=13765 RepID=A0AAV1F5S4_XYRNO|nr:uncharacterized protein LOC117814340 isoform X1 [Xyrichtys novacula]